MWFDLKGAHQRLLDKETRKRSGAFPFELPYRLISMFSVKGDTVLDPFAGGGTTLKACQLTNRNGIGFEIKEEAYLTSFERLSLRDDLTAY